MSVYQDNELNLPCLERVFSHLHANLHANLLVLTVKPLSKHFKTWVDKHPGARGHKLKPAAEVPAWALPALSVQQLRYKQKKQLLISAAGGGQLMTVRWLREQGCAWDLGASDAAAAGGHSTIVHPQESNSGQMATIYSCSD